MEIGIGKPVTMKSTGKREHSTTKKKDIAQPVKTCTKIIISRIKNILARCKRDQNTKIGNPENIEVKFKVRLLNIQICNLKTNLHH